MKLGQITMYGDNYGACLQAYALQKVIEKKGYEIQLINYHRCSRGAGSASSKVQTIKRLGIKGLIKYLRERKYIELRKNAYKKFRKNYLVFHEGDYYRDDNLSLLNEQFDGFICGSDMIWSEEFSEDWNFFFLNFAEPAKSFAYAPSFGKNSLSEDNKIRVSNYINKIKAITCRENGGVDMIHELGRKDAMQVLDPTMLLTKDEWCKAIPVKERIIEEPYVFAYLFGDETLGRKNFFAEVEKQIGKMYVLPRFTKKVQESFPAHGIGPWEYLQLFRDADFIVTDTFHGLMFSIIFRKPFVVLKREDGSNWAKYSDRMTSTLEMFGLIDRYIDENSHDLSSYKYINYDNHENIISSKRLASLDYIDEVLNGVRYE